MAGQFNTGALADAINNAVGVITEYEKRKKVQVKMKSAIEAAQKAGYKVSYKIDPATGGMAAPEISSKEKGPYEDIMREMLTNQGGQGQGGYEVSGLGPQGPRLTKKQPQHKPEVLGATKALLANGTGRIDIKNPLSGLAEKVDIDKPEEVTKAMIWQFGENFREDPELIQSGIIQEYDNRMKNAGVKQDEIQAGAEPKIQPFTKAGDVAGRSVGGKAYYKEAAAKYGDAKAAQIVDIAVKLQKQGMPIAKIEALMKEQGIDPALILGAYKGK